MRMLFFLLEIEKYEFASVDAILRGISLANHLKLLF